MEATAPELFPTLVAMAAAAVTAVAVDLGTLRRDAPAGFAVPWRRGSAAGVLAGFLFLGVYAPLTVVVPGVEPDLGSVQSWQIFIVQAMLAFTLLAWGTLAWGVPAEPAVGQGQPDSVEPEAPEAEAGNGKAARPPATLLGRLAAGFRLAEAQPLREVGLGVGVGLAIWVAVLLLLAAFTGLLQSLGSDGWLPQEAPAVVTFLASQSPWLRLAVALSAGFFEETFFRGFLQPRVGILFSTLLFALAHWSYGEPFMLIGVTLLSLAYAFLARWRRSVWAAVAAHATFDAVQLLVLLPWALKQSGALPPG